MHHWSRHLVRAALPSGLLAIFNTTVRLQALLTSQHSGTARPHTSQMRSPFANRQSESSNGGTPTGGSSDAVLSRKLVRSAPCGACMDEGMAGQSRPARDVREPLLTRTAGRAGKDHGAVLHEKLPVWDGTSDRQGEHVSAVGHLSLQVCAQLGVAGGR
jgi:hypothetical protein